MSVINPLIVSGSGFSGYIDPQVGIIKSLVSAAMAKGATALSDGDTAALKAALAADPSSVQSFDLTPRFTMGSRQTALIFKGELYLQKTALTYPATDIIFDCGAAPVAFPRGLQASSSAPADGFDGPAPTDAGASALSLGSSDGIAAQSYIADTVRTALKSGAKKLDAQAAAAVEAKVRAEGCKGIDCTEPRMLGSRTMAFTVDGELYAVNTQLTYPPSKTWYDCGPAPVAVPG